jgi:RND family efflux transporter MFP subunit
MCAGALVISLSRSRYSADVAVDHAAYGQTRPNVARSVFREELVMMVSRIGLAGLVLLSLAACGDDGKKQQAAPPAPPVTVAKPVVREIIETDTFTGRFAAIDAVDVRARVSGYLQSVGFEDGAVVKKGDLLFTIDKRPYQAAVAQAQAQVASAESRLAFAQSDLDRASSLSKSGNISEQTVDQRRQAYQIARADLDGAQAALRTANLNLDFTEVRAPVSGRIGRRLISQGNLVKNDDTLLTTIVSLDPIYFYFDIDERSYLSYQRTTEIGKQTRANDQGLPVKIGVSDETDPQRPARLDFVDNRIDQATGTIQARAIVPNGDLFLTPGLFGTIAIPGSKPYKGVLVPEEAIGTDQDKRIVWKVNPDNTVAAVIVRPGPHIDGYRVIRTGLTGDETIVIAGLQRVRPGAKVTPQMKELPPTRNGDAPPAPAAKAEADKPANAPSDSKKPVNANSGATK